MLHSLPEPQRIPLTVRDAIERMLARHALRDMSSKEALETDRRAGALKRAFDRRALGVLQISEHDRAQLCARHWRDYGYDDDYEPFGDVG